MWAVPPLSELYDCIQKPSDPIGKRMRAAYFLRHHYEVNNKNKEGGEHEQEYDELMKEKIRSDIIQNLGIALKLSNHGSLLRHEFAYVLGQIRDPLACSVLEGVLGDDAECVMVRHECAEALGAIGDKRSLPLLQKLTNDDHFEVSETCSLAVDYMLLKTDVACACMMSPYNSVDPAPASPEHATLSSKEIGIILRDSSLPLFERYRAMFSLRNRGGDECAIELGEALVKDQSSATFRHEVAYVLGQMQRDISVEALHASLERPNEHRMVRHESAEALGAIEGRWDDCERILRTFMDDEDDVVRESCVVALDAADYFGHNDNENGCSEGSNESDAIEKTLTFAGSKAGGCKETYKEIVGPEFGIEHVKRNHFNTV